MEKACENRLLTWKLRYLYWSQLSRMKNLLRFTGCLLLPLLVGGVSGYFTVNAVHSWYPQLNKPFFNPPNYLFGPVWTMLYLLMGVSFYLVLKQPPSAARKKAVIVFVVQLVLNFCWSLIFFNFHLLSAALAEILVMWLMILWMIVSFYPISKAASLLQLPYLAWVSFASALNAAIVYLN